MSFVRHAREGLYKIAACPSTVEEKGSLFQAAAVWPVESVEQAVAAVATLAREPSLRARTTA